MTIKKMVESGRKAMLGRRSLIIAGAAAAAEFSLGGIAMPQAFAEEPVRYPDARIKVLDPRFQSLVLGNAAVERIATGLRFCEGPVWFGDGRYLLWSDIPNDRIMRWDEETGAVSVFRKPSNYANGNTRDRPARHLRARHPTPDPHRI
jgi:gluconolactonase